MKCLLLKQSLKRKHVRHLQEKRLFAGPANDSVNSNKQLTAALGFFNVQGFTQSDFKKLQWSQVASEIEEYCTKWKT